MRLLLFLNILTLTFVHSSTSGQKLIQGIIIPDTYYYDFTSKINKQQYRISIGVPPGYSPNDTNHYQVLYSLDGNRLPYLMSMYNTLNLFNEYPKIIMIGIDEPVKKFPEHQIFRLFNYTPTHSIQEDSLTNEQIHVQVTSGGASSFLRVIKEEIMPFIDKTYKTTPDRSLEGGSASGLCALYILFEDPQLFSRFIIGSPMLDWDNHWITKREADFFANGQKISAKIFMSVGGLEGNNLRDMLQMANTLKSRKYAGLQLKEQIFEGETHLSVGGMGFNRGVRFIYSTDKSGNNK